MQPKIEGLFWHTSLDKIHRDREIEAAGLWNSCSYHIHNQRNNKQCMNTDTYFLFYIIPSRISCQWTVSLRINVSLFTSFSISKIILHRWVQEIPFFLFIYFFLPILKYVKLTMDANHTIIGSFIYLAIKLAYLKWF